MTLAPIRARRLSSVPGLAPAAAPVRAAAARDPLGTGTEGPAPQPQGLPEPGTWAATVVVAALEAMAGRRAPSTVERWLSPAVAAVVSRRHEVSARRRLPSQDTFVVRGVRTSSPAGGVIEAGMVVSDGRRHRAVAVRLEARRGRWVATALEVG